MVLRNEFGDGFATFVSSIIPKPTRRPSWFMRGNVLSLGVGNAIGRTESKRLNVNLDLCHIDYRLKYYTIWKGRWQHNNSQIIVRANRIETGMNKGDGTFDVT